MLLTVRHVTRYRYAAEVRVSYNELRLAPVRGEHQRVESFRLQTTPGARVYGHEEIGGPVHHFTLRDPHRELEIVAEATVLTLRANPFASLNLLHADEDGYDAMRERHVEYLLPSRYVLWDAETLRTAGLFRDPGHSAAKHLLRLNRHLHEWMRYVRGATDVRTTALEALAARAGVCQDFAHVMIALLRAEGIPARYCSGYLYSRGDRSLRGEAATHAWVEALLPDGRWLGLDPTNNLLVNERYVQVHTGRDYADCTPVRGVYTGPKTESLHVSVQVQEAAQQ